MALSVPDQEPNGDRGLEVMDSKLIAKQMLGSGGEENLQLA